MIFYKKKELMKLTKSENDALTSWKSSNPEAFETSKRKSFVNDDNDNCKFHKSDHNKKKGGKGITDTQLA